MMSIKTTKKNSPGMLSQVQIVAESTSMVGLQIIFMAVPESPTNVEQYLYFAGHFVSLSDSHNKYFIPLPRQTSAYG